MTSSGHIIVLPGIDGWSLFNRGIVPGLRAGGVACEIEFYDWTRGFLHLLGNLRDRRLHQEQAGFIADRLIEYRRSQPEAPLWLIGHSGGAALSLLALNRLSGRESVTGAILLAPAISAVFDIAASVNACECGIWNFRSWGDLPLLGATTAVLGNVDGRRSLSAGVRGFAAGNTQPASVRLHDVPWKPVMLRDGHFGGHFGCVNRRFIRCHVAPILVDRR